MEANDIFHLNGSSNGYHLNGGGNYNYMDMAAITPEDAHMPSDIFPTNSGELHGLDPGSVDVDVNKNVTVSSPEEIEQLIFDSPNKKKILGLHDDFSSVDVEQGSTNDVTSRASPSDDLSEELKLLQVDEYSDEEQLKGDEFSHGVLGVIQEETPTSSAQPLIVSSEENPDSANVINGGLNGENALSSGANGLSEKHFEEPINSNSEPDSFVPPGPQRDEPQLGLDFGMDEQTDLVASKTSDDDLPDETNSRSLVNDGNDFEANHARANEGAMCDETNNDALDSVDSDIKGQAGIDLNLERDAVDFAETGNQEKDDQAENDVGLNSNLLEVGAETEYDENKENVDLTSTANNEFETSFNASMNTANTDLEVQLESQKESNDVSTFETFRTDLKNDTSVLEDLGVEDSDEESQKPKTESIDEDGEGFGIEQEQSAPVDWNMDETNDVCEQTIDENEGAEKMEDSQEKLPEEMTPQDENKEQDFIQSPGETQVELDPESPDIAGLPETASHLIDPSAASDESPVNQEGVIAPLSPQSSHAETEAEVDPTPATEQDGEVESEQAVPDTQKTNEEPVYSKDESIDLLGQKNEDGNLETDVNLQSDLLHHAEEPRMESTQDTEDEAPPAEQVECGGLVFEAQGAPAEQVGIEDDQVDVVGDSNEEEAARTLDKQEVNIGETLGFSTDQQNPASVELGEATEIPEDGTSEQIDYESECPELANAGKVPTEVDVMQEIELESEVLPQEENDASDDEKPMPEFSEPADADFEANESADVQNEPTFDADTLQNEEVKAGEAKLPECGVNQVQSPACDDLSQGIESLDEPQEIAAEDDSNDQNDTECDEENAQLVEDAPQVEDEFDASNSENQDVNSGAEELVSSTEEQDRTDLFVDNEQQPDYTEDVENLDQKGEQILPEVDDNQDFEAQNSEPELPTETLEPEIEGQIEQSIESSEHPESAGETEDTKVAETEAASVETSQESVPNSLLETEDVLDENFEESTLQTLESAPCADLGMESVESRVDNEEAEANEETMESPTTDATENEAVENVESFTKVEDSTEKPEVVESEKADETPVADASEPQENAISENAENEVIASAKSPEEPKGIEEKTEAKTDIDVSAKPGKKPASGSKVSPVASKTSASNGRASTAGKVAPKTPAVGAPKTTAGSRPSTAPTSAAIPKPKPTTASATRPLATAKEPVKTTAAKPVASKAPVAKPASTDSKPKSATGAKPTATGSSRPSTATAKSSSSVSAQPSSAASKPAAKPEVKTAAKPSAGTTTARKSPSPASSRTVPARAPVANGTEPRKSSNGPLTSSKTPVVSSTASGRSSASPVSARSSTAAKPATATSRPSTTTSSTASSVKPKVAPAKTSTTSGSVASKPAAGRTSMPASLPNKPLVKKDASAVSKPPAGSAKPATSSTAAKTAPRTTVSASKTVASSATKPAVNTVRKSTEATPTPGAK